ncbi:MAG: DUF4003 family protein [Clostridia bacterium]|nr:DUF4003 family protein [Clostridia bacterium]
MEALIDGFEKNRNAAAAVFRFSSALMHCLCGLLATMQNTGIDATAIQELKRELKRETRLFSPLRGIAMPALLTQLSMNDHGTQMLDKMLKAYRLLREEGFLGTDYLPLPTYILARNEVDMALCRKTREIYLSMRENKKFLTGGDDTGFAALLAVYTDTPQTASELSLRAYSPLLKRFGARNETWLMSHILAFDAERIETNAESLIALFERLKADKVRFRGMESPILAVLTLLNIEERDAGEIARLSMELRARKGFSRWTLSNEQRNLCAAALLALSKIQGKESSRETRKLLYVLITTALVTLTTATIQAASAAAAQ